MERSEVKLLRISKATWEKIKKYAKYSDTHDDIINNILDKLGKQSKADKQSKLDKKRVA